MILQGDALRPSKLLEGVAERITTCVSGLPILHYAGAAARLREDVFGLMSHEPRLVQYGNMPRPPSPIGLSDFL